VDIVERQLLVPERPTGTALRRPNIEGPEFRKVTLQSPERAGLLGQGSVLMANVKAWVRFGIHIARRAFRLDSPSLSWSPASHAISQRSRR
jgi:hypothetical protein